MIDRIRTKMKDPRSRAEIETIASGALIILGLTARYAFQNVSLHNILMTIAAVVAGAGIAVRAFNSLRNRHISIELLVTIATVGALAIGEVWEAAAVTFLFVFGAYLEARTLSKTRQVLGELIDLAPVTALVLRDGLQVEVTPNEVGIGETVLLKPGSRVPVDGEVISGASAVDESSITGEPMPEEKAQGDKVFAGTVNLDGMMQVRATGVGSDTTLARIIARVEEAQEEKAPTQRFIEKFSKWYTPFIIFLSLGAYIITRDIDLALTLLVIGCPGALVISTPVSIIAGIGSAAKRGILIKGGEYLENAGKIGTLPMPDEFEALAGKGIRARYQGSEILVGSPKWMIELGIAVDDNVSARLNELRSDGKTAVLAAREGQVWGALAISDPIREDAAEMVKRLRADGIETIVMLTGDDPATANAVARQAGITDVRAGLLPDEKLDAIRQLQIGRAQ